MPDFTKIVESSSSGASSVVIINELGPLGSYLVDSLLELGCQVFYLGDKKKDQIDYLQGKNNFQVIKNFSQIQELNNMTYLFYLTKHLVNKNKLLTTIGKICQDKKAKLLLTTRGEEDLAFQILEKQTKLGVDIRVCFFQEIYGPRLNEGIVSLIIRPAYFGENISLPAEETIETSLVYYFDFIKGIIRAMFGPETNGKLLDVSGEKISFISLINQLKEKLGREVKIEFDKRKNKVYFSNISLKSGFDFGWRQETSLSEGIKETIFWLEKKEGKPADLSFDKKNGFTKPLTRTGFRKKFLFGLFFLLFLIFTLFVTPAILFLLNLSLANKDLMTAQKNWKKGNLGAVKVSIKKATGKINFAKKVFDLSSPFYETFGFGDGVRETEPLIIFYTKGISTVGSLLEIKDLLVPSIFSLIKGEKQEFSLKVNEANGFLDKIYTETSLIWSYFEGGELSGILARILKIENFLSSAEVFLPEFRKEISRTRLILPKVPDLIGEKGRKSYLIIFQNNQELRPTGGFIGSVGVVTFDDGHLLDFEVHNVFELDEMLNGQIEPPKKMKDYYGETNWFLRDANWEPDFPTSAKKIEWFFEKETGRIVDGVMAVNFNFAKKLLEINGEVSLSDGGEKINSQNLLERAAYSKGYVQASASGELKRKPDLLGDLIKTIFEQTKEADEFKLIKIAGAIYSSLKGKELLLYFNQSQINLLFRNFNWDGSLQENLACQRITDRCLGDYLFINEANLGANKTNYFLKRMMGHQVEFLEEGKLEETLKIYYQNLSMTDDWPGGRYKNYLRVYLPSGTELESIMINDPAEANYWLQIPPEKIEVATEGGRIVFGFLLEIPAKTGRVVEIKYQPPFVLDYDKSFTYTTLIQRQSGANETPLSLIIKYPKLTKPLKILPKGVLTKDQILINDQLNTDKIFRVDFGK